MLHKVFHGSTKRYLWGYRVKRRCGARRAVNRNEDRFAVAVMSHDDIVEYVP